VKSGLEFELLLVVSEFLMDFEDLLAGRATAVLDDVNLQRAARDAERRQEVPTQSVGTRRATRAKSGRNDRIDFRAIVIIL
jgi:hypothetical protein